MQKLLRAHVLHTPDSPFETEGNSALVSHVDGAVVIEKGLIQASGEYEVVRKQFPDAVVEHHPKAFIMPGFVDCHVHYPQIAVLGSMGMELLDWLELRTFPEESRLSDATYAKQTAKTFLRTMLCNGTTTAMVFGAHFLEAQNILFEEAQSLGLNIISGLVTSDQNIPDSLKTTPEKAYIENKNLIEKWHRKDGKDNLRYAVMPRFSVTCSDALLEVCGTLMQEYPDVYFHTHINENPSEIAFVKELFPWAEDYLGTYERYNLIGKRSVLAHNVHVSDDALTRLAKAEAAIAHCPSSNMFIGSGLFDMRRHLDHKIRLGLGSDVGGGTGFSLFKEGLMAYQMQMLKEDGYRLNSSELLYLATKGGAEALGLDDQLGDLTVGKRADLVLVEAPEGSTLSEALKHSPNEEAALSSLFTLAREDCIKEVYVAGKASL